MRKHVVFIMAISSVSFSFYKFQGPYIQPGKFIKENYGADRLVMIPDKVAFLPEEGLAHKADDFDLPLLYESHTKSVFCTSPSLYCISDGMRSGPIFRRSDGKDPVYDFLKCNFDYDPIEFWKLSNLKEYESETSGRIWGPLLFAQDIPDVTSISSSSLGSLAKLYSDLQNEIFIENEAQKINVNYLTFYARDIPRRYSISPISENPATTFKQNFDVIRFKQHWAIANNQIEIANQEDGVELHKKDKKGNFIKKIDLKAALLNYYKPETSFNILKQKDSDNNVKSSSLSNNTIGWTATSLNYSPIDKEQYNLLENSTILALWDVRAEVYDCERIYSESERQASFHPQRPIYSVMIGLARDNRLKDNESNAQFHFVVDLKRDIEVLFGLEPSQSPKSKMVDQSTQTDAIEVETKK